MASAREQIEDRGTRFRLRTRSGLRSQPAGAGGQKARGCDAWRHYSGAATFIKTSLIWITGTTSV